MSESVPIKKSGGKNIKGAYSDVKTVITKK